MSKYVSIAHFNSFLVFYFTSTPYFISLFYLWVLIANVDIMKNVLVSIYSFKIYFIEDLPNAGHCSGCSYQRIKQTKILAFV